jgi:hypothetical protein
MNMHIPGQMNPLLNTDSAARSYFASLPDYIQDMVAERCSNVSSIHELKRYAENLMQGDK